MSCRLERVAGRRAGPASPAALEGSRSSDGVNSFKPFRGAGSRRAKAQSVPSSDLWGIDLGPVDEPMVNGRTERMDLTTSERISLGRVPKRAVAQPIGKPAERNFACQSVP